MDRKQRYIQKLKTRDIPLSQKKIVAFLVLETDSVRKYPIKSGINFIGNDKDVDIQLNVPGVSGFHAMIETSDDGTEHFIEDLDSTNGTHLGPSHYPLGAWKLYQIIHKKMVSIGPAACTYQYHEPNTKGNLGEEEEESEIPFTVDSRPFGSPIMIQPKRDFLPSDILKQNSSPQSNILVKNQDIKDACNISMEEDRKSEVCFNDSSDLDLELPDHFGKIAENSAEIVNLGNNGDNYELRDEENQIIHETGRLQEDVMTIDEQTTIKDLNDKVEIEKSPQKAPRKIKLAGKKSNYLKPLKVEKDNESSDSEMLDLNGPSKHQRFSNLKRKNLLQKDQKSLPGLPVNTNTEIESDESSLDHQTSDQILQDLVRESKKSKKIRPESTEKDAESSIESRPLITTSAQAEKQKVGCDAPAIEPSKSPKKKKKIQRKTLSPPENSKNMAKENLNDSRRNTFDGDLSIAIALSGGRGRRAAASKALEKTKDMYHNLPSLHEEPLKKKEEVINTLPKDTVEASNLDQVIKPKDEKSTIVKNQKKSIQKKADNGTVKLETEVIPLPIKSEANESNILKEKNIKSYKIAFTGGYKDDRKPFEAMIRKFGGTVVESWYECTHLVTDKIRRTAKFLCALTTGKFIMDRMWLDACKKEGRFVDESIYLLRDVENEKKYSFRLKHSLEKSQNGLRLLDNLRFYASSNVKPDHDTLSEILNASGGTLELSAPTEKQPVIILSCTEDFEEIGKLKKLGFDQIFSMEFILTGLLRQKLDFSRFESGSTYSSCPPRKPPRVKTLPKYGISRSDSGIHLNSNNAKDMFTQVSVKKLKEIWENVALSNGWKFCPNNSINLFQVSDKSAMALKIDKNPFKDRFDKCDMILCGIKTIIVNDVKMHQIELGCHHCDSRFIMTAAHECEKEDIGELMVQNDSQTDSLNIIL